MTSGQQNRSRRVRALLATGLAVGVASTATVAAWTDTEWVFGADSGGGAIRSSEFEVQQNVWDGAGGTANFVDRETQAGAGTLSFAVNAATMSPGDTVYAPMQLRTTIRSVVGEVSLAGALLGSSDAALFGALRYQVRTGVARADCNAAGIGGGAGLVSANTALATGSGAVVAPLAAATTTAPGTALDVCFALTLPAGSPDSLQGLGARPVWAFNSISR